MKKVLGFLVLIVLIVLAYHYYYMNESLKKVVPLTKEPVTVVANLEKYVFTSLPLPIELNTYENYRIKLLAIDGIESKGNKLNVSYKATVSKKDLIDECIITLTYSFYLSEGNLNLSTIEIDYNNSKGKFLVDLKNNDEFIIGGLEEKWQINTLSLPKDANEIIELSENRIIVR